MSKDHIKSDIPVTTDWWNENVNEVYYSGCHIGWSLQAINNRKNSEFAFVGKVGFPNPKVLRRDNNVESVKKWLQRIQNNRNRNGDGTFDFGDDARVVLLNLSGMMIFNRNNEIEEQALQTGCDFIRSISSKLVEWIENDDEMRNRFRTLLYSEMDKETEFSSTFEFLIPQNELVYGSSFAEALNECFLTFGRHVASWKNVTWATLNLHLENFSPHENDKKGIRFRRTVYLPGDGFDMTEPVNFTAYDFNKFTNKGPRKLTKCVLTIGRTFAEEKKRKRKKINTRPSFTIEE